MWENKHGKAKHEKHIIMESEILNEFRKWIFIMFMNAQVAYIYTIIWDAAAAGQILLHTIRKWGWRRQRRYKERINIMI